MLTKDVKLASYCAFAGPVVLAQNKHHISVFNGAGSGVILRLRKLFFTNMQIAAVTGVGIRMDLRKISTCASGTDLTIQKHDSAIATLPAQVLVQSGATCTDAGLNCALTFHNDEAVASGNNQSDYQHLNWLPEGEGIAPPTLREGEGFTVQQITNSIVGSYGWLLIFTAEPKL